MRKWLLTGILSFGCFLSLFNVGLSQNTTDRTGEADQAQGGEAPIEIDAQDGIEWLRDEKQYIARGNAKATHGDLTVQADTLTAHYKGGEDGERQVIFRMDADGSVIVAQDNTEAYGDKAVYHIEQKVAVIIGEDLQIQNAKAVIKAEESLEFWEEKQLAVARGEATVIQEGNRLVASILTAHILEGEAGRQEIQRIDALDGVHISTGTEIIRGAEGVYEVSAQEATICGQVKITRGENQLNGECAIVNMQTGRSRLIGGDGGRVQGLILPTQ